MLGIIDIVTCLVYKKMAGMKYIALLILVISYGCGNDMPPVNNCIIRTWVADDYRGKQYIYDTICETRLDLFKLMDFNDSIEDILFKKPITEEQFYIQGVGGIDIRGISFVDYGDERRKAINVELHKDTSRSHSGAAMWVVQGIGPIMEARKSTFYHLESAYILATDSTVDYTALQKSLENDTVFYVRIKFKP